MSEEFRRAKRKQVAERIDVTDVMLGKVIGLVGNISETGMMLLTNQISRDDALFQLNLTLSDKGGNQRTISIGAHQLWSEPASTPGQYWIGYRFIDLGQEDLIVLRIWIDLPGSQYI